MEKLYTIIKNKTGAEYGSDHELLIAKFRLKLKKVGNTTRPLSFFTFMHWRRKWQPTPVFLPGESLGTGELGELGGLPSMGSHRVGHD